MSVDLSYQEISNCSALIDYTRYFFHRHYDKSLIPNSSWFNQSSHKSIRAIYFSCPICNGFQLRSVIQVTKGIQNERSRHFEMCKSLWRSPDAHARSQLGL